MSKVPVHQVIQEQIDADIWREDEMSWWTDEYREDYWDGVHRGERSWMWYVAVSHAVADGWKEITISPDHKVITVVNWLKEHYPDCRYKTEDQHMLIEDPQVATIVALKWA